MKTVIWAALCACLLSALSGCGTITNFCPSNPEGCMRPYGGAAMDLESIGYITHHTCGGAPPPHWPLQLALNVIDLPPSVVADTILLPVTFIVTGAHKYHDDGSAEHADGLPSCPAAPAKACPAERPRCLLDMLTRD
jgi:uncharacterized protein YceK